MSSSFSAILAATLPVFLIIATGAAFRRAQWWPESGDPHLTRLAINVFYPCLIAHHVLGNPALQSPGVLAWSAGLGFTLLLVSFLLGFLLARSFGFKSGSGLRTFTVCAGIQNYGFLPIPIIATLFAGEDAHRALGVLFLHNLGLEVAIWTIGVAIMRESDHAPWRHLINTPLITILASATLTLYGGAHLIPSPILATIKMLGQAAIPISLFIAGASLWTANTQTRWLGSWRVPLAACILRFLLLPVVFFSAALFLPISIDLQRNLIIQGAMPAGAFVIVLARHYGGHPVTAGQIVIATSLVSLLAIPSLLTLGLHLLR